MLLQTFVGQIHQSIWFIASSCWWMENLFFFFFISSILAHNGHLHRFDRLKFEWKETRTQWVITCSAVQQMWTNILIISKAIASHFHKVFGFRFDLAGFSCHIQWVRGIHRQTLCIFASHFNCEIWYSASSSNGALSGNLHFSVKLMKWSRHLCCIHVLLHASLLLFISGQSRSDDFDCSSFSFPFAIHFFWSSFLCVCFSHPLLHSERVHSFVECHIGCGSKRNRA